MNTFSAGNVRFYDAVNMIHDVIRGANPFPYSLKGGYIDFSHLTELKKYVRVYH